MLGAVDATQAAVLGHSTAQTAAAKHKKAAKKAAKKNGLAAPGLVSPANGAHVEQIPTLTWSSVRGAAEYEYQVAADPKFDSIVLGGIGAGKGSSTTYNLAAGLEELVPDGTYYWRVRGLSAAKQPGAWSYTRSLVKAWATAPQLYGPADGAAIAWPTVPLVLSWSSVPYASEYIVTIASDPGLSNIVLGTATSPQKTAGTVFALPSTLAAGQYYWAITPVDAQGHRGARSAVESFSWSWPTSTTTGLTDLDPNPEVFDPQFDWAPIPGASKYEVEVNSAEQFPVGSKWCCTDPTIGTSLSPTENLANNEYYWRVRAIDANGNAGQWNVGVGFPGAEHPPFGFTKAFDSVTPTVPNLTMTNVNGQPIAGPDPKTNTPIVTWKPVDGAGSYEVQVTPYYEGYGCNWSEAEPQVRKTFETSSLAWTPIGGDGEHIGPKSWPFPRSLSYVMQEEGTEWCVRVLAKSDHDARGNSVISEWSYLGGENHPAFTFENQPAPGSPEGLETHASNYLPVHTGTSLITGESTCGATSACRSTPFFTWERVPGATSYDIVIARDKDFTNIVDIASTIVPAYAPPLGEEEPLDDETTTYYWAVVPVLEVSKGRWAVFHEPPNGDAPQAFDKSSIPPTPLAPLNGVDVSNQPTFRWTPAEGALNYTLQVSDNASFGAEHLIDEVKHTDSTAYTSSSTYPSNATLYWRVRANDTNNHTEGLNWSSVETFTRTLPVPAPAAGNPTSGQAIPVLSWTPVTGATTYEVHIDEGNGGTKDFTLDSTAFTPTEWYGTGVWRWEVRAEFPSGSYQSVQGGYFAPQAFVRTLAPPSDAVGTKAGGRTLIYWNPDPYAKEYKVEVSTTESFSSTISNDRISALSWAPNLNLTEASNKGTLYWRVAAIDQGDNLGPYATGTFVAPKPAKAKCTVKKVKKGKKTVKECVVVKKKAKKHH
jgi:hypothetical protein